MDFKELAALQSEREQILEKCAAVLEPAFGRLAEIEQLAIAAGGLRVMFKAPKAFETQATTEARKKPRFRKAKIEE